MASNSFGKIFRVTTWGESHGKAVGVVIDGCPAGLEISEEEINLDLKKRSPGKNPFVSPRKEEDKAEIFSGVFEGKTTGTPICIIIPNQNADSSKYEPIKDLLRPGHANYTYIEKYGIYDYRGGGRASGRETACRVAAGAVAKKFLQKYNIQPIAYIKEIAGIHTDILPEKISHNAIQASPIFCPDPEIEKQMMSAIDKAKHQNDSVGGVVELFVAGLSVGLGDPVYEKLEANLASAFMSIPASKGFEIGSGFSSAKMRGSSHNDLYVMNNEKVKTTTNHHGGILGGISSGMPLVARVAFKPTSSIMQTQETLDVNGNSKTLTLPENSKHDPCIAIRAVPVVEAMASLVIADAILFNLSSRMDLT